MGPFLRAAPLAAFSLLSACGEALPAVQRFGGFTMGSTYEVKFVGPQALESVQAAVVEELHGFDATFSRWRGDSEISRVNRHASTEPLPVSARFAAVLSQALAIAAATDGAFDPTVEPLTALYRAAKEDPRGALDEKALAAAKQHVDHRFVSVRDGTVGKARPTVRLDLDGIVAGACADAIAARLDALGVPAFYLEITGEVFCRGEKAPGVPWRIGVADPAAGAEGENVPIEELAVRDRAVCTSGDYRNALIAGGRVIHHVFDPRTGRSADSGAASVSVLAPSAAVADALGTAFLVLGEAGTERLLPSLQSFGELGVLILSRSDEGTVRTKKLRWPA